MSENETIEQKADRLADEIGDKNEADAVFVNIVVARAYAALFNSGCSFSGFNQTFSGNSQFLISPRHRFG